MTTINEKLDALIESGGKPPAGASPIWELVHEGNGDDGITDPEVRRIAVPDGWLYQVERSRNFGEQGEVVSRYFHPSTFVPTVVSAARDADLFVPRYRYDDVVNELHKRTAQVLEMDKETYSRDLSGQVPGITRR